MTFYNSKVHCKETNILIKGNWLVKKRSNKIIQDYPTEPEIEHGKNPHISKL